LSPLLDHLLQQWLQEFPTELFPSIVLVIAGEKTFPPPNLNLKIVRIQRGGGFWMLLDVVLHSGEGSASPRLKNVMKLTPKRPMVFWGVRVGSHRIKNMNEVLKFLRNVGQCSTFEGKNIFEFGVVKKSYAAPIKKIIFGQGGL
jgi:hypothetical protein